MANFSENQTSTEQCDGLLLRVNQIYREIETLYQNIHHKLRGATLDTVQKAADLLDILEKEARTVDTLLAERLKSTHRLAESTKAHLSERAEILHRLHRSNRQLVAKAENTQALLRHELASMAKNRNALKGYKPVETERKSIVRDFF